MKMIIATAPWLVAGELSFLEQHGFHPEADPGRTLRERRVLAGQTSVPIVVPDKEAAAARVLLAHRVNRLPASLQPITFILAILALALVSAALFSSSAVGNSDRALVACTGAGLGLLAWRWRAKETRA